MADSPVDMDKYTESINKMTDDEKRKLRDFDEEEAYFELLQIFSYAQSTKDYAKLQADLNEWKKRYPIDLFSEEYKYKIKYMLSKEFLETVLKDFIIFDELSKKDPSVGLEKLRKILSSAEKHKDANKLDKDLENLYKEYPLSFLKEKYPHKIPYLLGETNRQRILEKFDSSTVIKEYKQVIENPDKYENVQDFRSRLEELQEIFPIQDFSAEYKPEVEKMLAVLKDDKKLEELFPPINELDLTQGETIPLDIHEDISRVSKDAFYDFNNIMDKNSSDINGLFTWLYTYRKDINTLDSNTKEAIVTTLMNKYEKEMPPIGTHYQIPLMNSKADDLLSLEEYSSMDELKKASVLQLLGLLSTDQELTDEDIYRLDIIDNNIQKAKVIEDVGIDAKLDVFMKEFPENKLTPYDELYIPALEGSIEEKTTDKSNEETVLMTSPEEVLQPREEIRVSDKVIEPEISIVSSDRKDLDEPKNSVKNDEQTACDIQPNVEFLSDERQNNSEIEPVFETSDLDSEDENTSIDSLIEDTSDEELEPIQEVREPSKKDSFFARLRALVKKDEEEPLDESQVKRKNPASGSDAGGDAVGIARPGEEVPVEGLELLHNDDFEQDK